MPTLAIDSLKLAAVEKKPEERESAEDLFIHSTIFVLVDKQARLRGVFETGGEGVDWRQVEAGHPGGGRTTGAGAMSLARSAGDQRGAQRRWPRFSGLGILFHQAQKPWRTATA